MRPDWSDGPSADSTTASGALLRPLSGAERQLWLLGIRNPFNVILVVRFADHPRRPTVEALRAPLRDALAMLQGRHPLLRTRVGLDEDGAPGFYESEAPIALRVVEDRETLDGAIEDELATRLDLEQGPALRLSLFAPGEAEAPPPTRVDASETPVEALLLAFDHTASDGVSMLSFLGELLDALPPPIGTGRVYEARAATPANIAPLAQAFPREARGLGMWGRYLGLRWREQCHRVRYGRPRQLSCVSAPGDPGAGSRTHVIRRQLGVEEVAGLEEIARARGCSLHGLLTAAQLLSLRALFKDAGRVPLAAYSPTDLRPRVRLGGQRGVADDHLGQFVGYARSLHEIAGNDDLMAVAQQVSSALRRRLRAFDDVGYQRLNHLSMGLLSPFLPNDPRGAKRLSRLSARHNGHSTVLSGLRAPALAEGLDGPWVVVGNIPWCGFTSASVQSAGQLRWSFSWTEPLLDGERALGLVERSLASLRDVLSQRGQDRSPQRGPL